MLGSSRKSVIALITVGTLSCGTGTSGGVGGSTGGGGLPGGAGLPEKGGAHEVSGSPGEAGEQPAGGSRGTGASSTSGALGSGGSSSKGGGAGIGGTQASGGAQGKGGTPDASGGHPSGGGAQGTGGRGTGAASGNGGAQGKGGMPDAGGLRGTGGAPGSGGTAGPQCPDGWKLSWSDEFDGPAGSAADAGKWNYDYGPNWYNGELQYYSQGTDNAKLDGNGNLVIEARKETREGKQYTSARLKTEGKKTFTYGRFEGRMKLPYGQGMWPAFWLLGAEGGSWPACGEIDIMENLGREPTIAHGSMHGPGYSGSAGPTATYTLPDGAKFSDDFHIFAIEWETNAIRWYVDGNLYSTKTTSDTGGNTWVFNHPFFFILNLAVGGDWPGSPDSTTVFPQKMVIDYVRLCQH